MFKVLPLNKISTAGLRRLPRERYEVASEIGHPDAVLVRSHDMHTMEIPDTVLAVARLGLLDTEERAWPEGTHYNAFLS